MCIRDRLKGKGNKARLVPLENQMIAMLKKYIEYEKNSRVFFNPDDLLFLNKSGMQFTRQGIGYIVKKYSAMARKINSKPVSYTHLRAHETVLDIVFRILLENKNKKKKNKMSEKVTAIMHSHSTNTLVTRIHYSKSLA